MENRKYGSTPRTTYLNKCLLDRAASNRTKEWFTKEMLPDIGFEDDAKDMPIIIRRALAFGGMLEAMVLPENSEFTHTYEIKQGELIIGTMPLGSLGLGKVFPNYLTEIEKEVAFFSNRSIDSVLAHNVPDFKRVLDDGLEKIIEFCQTRLESLKIDRDYPIGKNKGVNKKIAFYESAKTCCLAVIDYAEAFAQLAEDQAKKETNKVRAKELREISEICRKVPRQPAETFREALQSIWFVHLALHASASHLSIGRLDQLINHYYENDVKSKVLDREKAVELLECFWIKAAERLISNTQHLVEQDHTEFSTGMGENPFLVDQEATINQFMQNVVIGGQTRGKQDATNECTYMILDVCSNLGLPTPVLNVRLHKNSPEKLIHKVAETIMTSNCGLPAVYNDDVIIPGILTRDPRLDSDIPEEEAYDYVVDGCWEPTLNAKCDFNYNMISALTVLECALNGGAQITKSKMYLRGPKKSFSSPLPSQIDSFEQLKSIFKGHLRYFTNKSGLELYSFYMLEGSTTPTPFFSALLGKCLEKGIDKTWGGADYILNGIVFFGMPNCANALASIKQWVYDKKEYSLEEVVDALKNNFEGYDEMLSNFKKTPKFGNNISDVDNIMSWLMDSVYEAVVNAEILADKVFLTIPETSKEVARVSMLRQMAGYAGVSMKERFGKDFNITFTAGCGTFAQYVFLGQDCAASADGRLKDQPVAPNFSPTSGTALTGVGGVLDSLCHLGLERFGLGVIIDLCFEKETASPELFMEVIRKFRENKGSIITMTVVDHEKIKEIYSLCNQVRDKEKDTNVLSSYNDISVRVGGWNGPFVALTKKQQEDYLMRSVNK